MASTRVDGRVGQVLGGRFRLRAPIGTGASATVYLADDDVLHRAVAVKVLHPALAGDESFLRRFRAEARAAAALNHPNILAVYDWGEDDGEPYLVSEHLAGGSVRSMLQAGHRLSPAQALLVALDAARGLEYAHRKGFVHRDIKPANLLFDADGRLRIADFGLARALAEASWTDPLGGMIGTAKYASPEQALGRPLEGRSDVYSLALVTVEMITGTVPFVADTTVGTVMARVGQPLPVPDGLGRLGDALAHAGDPDVEQRWDAATFGLALLDAAADHDPPRPLPLEPTVVGTDAVPSPLDRTAQAPVAPGADDDITVLGVAPVAPDEDITIVGAVAGPARPSPASPPSGVFDAEADDAASPVPPTAATTSAPEHEPRRRWPLVLAAVLAVGVLVAGGLWVRRGSAAVALPDMVGRPAAEAQAALVADGWTIERVEEFRDATVAGTVVEQQPLPGSIVERGGVVRLVVSLGPPPVAVPPDLPGRTLADATAVLTGAGLTAGPVTESFSEDVPASTVIALAPETPPEVPRGGAVGLVVSKGPEPRTIPDGLVGASSADATAALKALGLVAGPVEEFSETVPKGSVIAVKPAAGQQAAKGSTVQLVVSKGPPTVAVPDVTGLSVVDAAARLEAAGLVVSGTQGSPTQKVTGTSPAAGATVRKGSAVSLLTG